MSLIQSLVMDEQERPDYKMPPDIQDPDIPTIFVDQQAVDEPPF